MLKTSKSAGECKGVKDQDDDECYQLECESQIKEKRMKKTVFDEVTRNKCMKIALRSQYS